MTITNPPQISSKLVNTFVSNPADRKQATKIERILNTTWLVKIQLSMSEPSVFLHRWALGKASNKCIPATLKIS